MYFSSHINNSRSVKYDINEFPVITDKLICPVCCQKAFFTNSFVKCSNLQCGITFPIIDNIPILINETDSIFSINNYMNSNSENRIKNKSIRLRHVAKTIFKFLPSLSNNLSSKRNFTLLTELLSQKTNPKILIIGGATITTNTEMIFNPNNIVIESDVCIGPRTQIIIDSHHIPFESETFDLLIFQAVLEYVSDPYKCVQEAHRVLNKDGLIFSSTPFMQQISKGNPVDFTRFTQLGHRRLFRAFTEIESGVFAGTGVALGWSLRVFFSSLINNKYFRIIIEVLVTFLFFWLKYIDYIIINNNGTFEGASGFYFIGRKSDKIVSDIELIKSLRKK